MHKTSGPSKTSGISNTFKRHWPYYLIESWVLSMFMISASFLTTLLEYPRSPLHQALPESLSRHALLGVGLGLVIAGVMYSPWGKKSGAHINPAVTWAFYRLGKIDRIDAVFYTLAQFAGAIAAALLMTALLGAPYRHPAVNHAATLPGPEGPLAAFVAEFLIALILMVTALVTANHKPLEKWAGAITGALIVAFVTFETPYSGMSLNPARSFGTALVSGEWKDLWVYATAPMLAMLLGAYIYATLLHKPLTGTHYPTTEKQGK